MDLHELLLGIRTYTMTRTGTIAMREAAIMTWYSEAVSCTRYLSPMGRVRSFTLFVTMRGHR